MNETAIAGREPLWRQYLAGAPTHFDGRCMQILSLATYSVAAREIFHYERSLLVWAGCVAFSLFLDALFGSLRFGRISFPTAALIIALGGSIQFDARQGYWFFMLIALAHCSKALVLYRGRHIFNPTNFAVIIMLTLFPESVTGFGALFSGFGLPTLFFLAMGTITVAMARQFAVSYSWLLGGLVLAPVRAWIGGKPLLFALGTFANPMILLFTFHMISDPATTPRTRPLKIAFGLMVALVDALLRIYEWPHGQFYALFLVTCFMPWVSDYESRLPARKPA